jgi:DnaK suppressor protein
MPRTRQLDHSLREELRGRLLAARDELLRTVATTDEELATLEAHQPGGPIEDVAHDEALAILSRVDDRERHALDEIFIAFAKLGTDLYGICEGCGGKLPLARLRAMPTARYCLACQTRGEAPPG